MHPTPTEPAARNVVALRKRMLRLLPITGALLAGLFLLYFGYQLAFLISGITGAGAPGGIPIFRTLGRAALTFLLANFLFSGAAALLCRREDWALVSVLVGLIGGVAAPFIPSIEIALVDFSCWTLERLGTPLCM